MASVVAALERLSQLQGGTKGTNIGVRGIILRRIAGGHWGDDEPSIIRRLVELAGPSLEVLDLILPYTRYRDANSKDFAEDREFFTDKPTLDID